MKKSPKDIPRLVLEAEPVSDYLTQIRKLESTNRIEFRKLIRSIVEEGKRFAETERGKIVKRQLADSDFIRNGWFFWNLSGYDFLLNETDESESTPSELWQQIWGTVISNDMEYYLSSLLKDVRFYEEIHSTEPE